MTGNPTFTSLISAIAAVQTAIDNLEAAEVTALTRVKGSAAARNEKRAALVSLLEALRANVQTIADGTPESAASIIEGARFALRKIPVVPPREFSIVVGRVVGSVKLTVPAAARRASYDWEYSADGGKTWIDGGSTLQCRTSISGIPGATTMLFRYRAVTKGGRGDWNPPASFFAPWPAPKTV